MAAVVGHALGFLFIWSGLLERRAGGQIRRRRATSLVQGVMASTSSLRLESSVVFLARLLCEILVTES